MELRLQDINNIGVVGAGTMGFGIAINFALGGYPTIVCDINDTVLQQSRKNILSALGLFVDEKLITRKRAKDTYNLISTTTDLSKVAVTSDFITEAIVERPSEKKHLFNKLDELCPPHSIIVSNTSSLLLSDFGADVKRQDKIAITHYFAPGHIVPGVEVAKGPGTSDETLNITYDLMKKIRKVPIRVLKELPGCVLNRIQNATRREVNRLWAEGAATAEDIELGIKSTFGFRMPHEGPLLHYDLAGLWQWPKDVRINMSAREISGDTVVSSESIEKIRQRYIDGKPWLIDPKDLDKLIEKRDREYVRRLRDLYWSQDE